jgi:DNA-binding MarR family transcriptional regulator
MMVAMQMTEAPDWAAGPLELIEDRHALAKLAAQWFAALGQASVDQPSTDRPPTALDAVGSPGALKPPGGGHLSAGEQAFDTLADVPRSVAEELSAIWLLLRTISLTDFGGLDPPLASREFAALHLLQTTGPIRVIDIGELLRMDKSTTSRVVRAMLDRGLLDRARHPTDGRAFLVELTAAGREVVGAAVTTRELTLVTVLAQWDEQARSALLEALLRLRREWSSLMPERWQSTTNIPVED